jgi:hypothetical protein
VLVTFAVVGLTTALRVLGVRGAMLGFVVGAVFVIISGLTDLPGPGTVMALFAAGGATALALMLAVSRRGREEPDHPDGPNPLGTTRLVAHAVRLGAAVSVATMIAVGRDLPFAYWVPLTVLAVLQPENHASLVRVLQRCIGTIIGVALVAAATELTSDVSVLIALVGVTSFALFALRERSYYWVVVALTPTALLMISTAAYEGWSISGQRLVDTAVGLGIALVVTAATAAIEHRSRPAPSSSTSPT